MKTCLITGANAGIGEAAAIQIAAKGYRVYVGSRNPERGAGAVERIKAAAGSNAVELLVIDLASKVSIQHAIEELQSKTKVLDVLIHNAAAFDLSQKKPEYSPDGIETIWATNHVGPVVLTAGLLPLLQQSKQGRVITVASKGLVLHPWMKVNLSDPEFKKRRFSVPAAYYQSKLAQIMFTYRLAEKQKENNITANCVRVTNVKIDLARYPNLSPLMKWMYGIKRRFSITPAEMASTYTWLATDQSLAGVSGKYFNEQQKMVSSGKYSMDQRNIEALMKLTHQYL